MSKKNPMSPFYYALLFAGGDRFTPCLRRPGLVDETFMVVWVALLKRKKFMERLRKMRSVTVIR